MISRSSSLMCLRMCADEIVYSAVAAGGGGSPRAFQLNPVVFNIPNTQLS